MANEITAKSTASSIAWRIMHGEEHIGTAMVREDQKWVALTPSEDRMTDEMFDNLEEVRAWFDENHQIG